MIITLPFKGSLFVTRSALTAEPNCIARAVPIPAPGTNVAAAVGGVAGTAPGDSEVALQ